MVNRRPTGGKSSSGLKQSRSASPGRVNKHAKPSNAKSTTILSQAGSGAVNPGLLSPGYQPPRSPIVTRQAAAKSGAQQSSTAGSSSSTTPAGIPTCNEFDVLSENDDDDDIPLDPSISRVLVVEEQSKESKVRLPPIHVVDTLFSTVDDLLIENDVSFTMKVTKKSVRVTLTEKSEFDKTLKVLKSNDIKYFTYELSNCAPVKIVLQGFPLVEIPSLTRKLARAGVRPNEIKMLSKATTVTGNHALYVLIFDRGSIKLQDLRKVKFVDGFGVTWRYFTKRASDAAQCHRCQKFGHGSRNCNLPPRCVKCGEAHLTEGCALPRKANLGENNNAQQFKTSVKCANCLGNHTANFRGCAARKSYIEALEKTRKKTSSMLPNAPRTSAPTVPMKKTTPAFPPGWGRTYANVAAGDGIPDPNVTAGGGLFTLSEFLSLARDMFTRLSGCQNKQQQFFALSELMGKYLYNVQG